MKKICSLLIGLLALILGARGQVNFFFVPEIYGRSIDGLGSFQIQYVGSEKISGQVFITVKDNLSGALVVNVMTPFFVLNPGTTNFSRVLYSNSAFKFSSNPLGSIANQTRRISPGEYSFCFRFVPQDKGSFDEYENCFDGEIQPLVPLTLLDPAHEDTICNKRPMLSWQPPLPFSSSMRFRLILTEKTGSSAVEDLLTKTPLLFLDNISSTTIAYPSINPELKEGHTYVWQVIAHEQATIISKSEIWEFTIKCKEELAPIPVDSYRELKLMVNGNYYIANGYMRFSFRNDYNTKLLKYDITDISAGGKSLKNLPEINLTRGINNVDLDLRDLDLENGRQYLLKVFPFNEPALEVRFVYYESRSL